MATVYGNARDRVGPKITKDLILLFFLVIGGLSLLWFVLILLVPEQMSQNIVFYNVSMGISAISYSLACSMLTTRSREQR